MKLLTNDIAHGLTEPLKDHILNRNFNNYLLSPVARAISGRYP